MDHWIWQDDKYFKWWMTILYCVNHESRKFPVGNEIFICNSGQSFRSIEQWTDLFSCSKKTTERFFSMLKNDRMITTEIVGKGNRRKHLLTVVNWEKYQQQETENYPERVPENTPKEYPKIPSNKNDKKDKKERIDKNILSDIFLFQVDKSTLNDNQKKYFEIAFSFWEIISKNMSDLKIKSKNIENPTYGKWVEPIRQLFEIDKRTIDEIRGVFKFLKHDEFWRAQIRSTSKLRKKNKNDITYFEELLIQSKNEEIGRNNSGKSKIPSNDEALAGIITRIEQTQL